jgi:hypothetical protein
MNMKKASALTPQARLLIARQLRERFFKEGKAIRPHEPWETIGDARRGKWIMLVDAAEELLGSHARAQAKFRALVAKEGQG